MKERKNSCTTTNYVSTDHGILQLSFADLSGTIAASQFAGTATNGYSLQLVSGVPTWQSVSATNATNISGGAAGELPYQTGSGATSFTAAGTSGQVLISGGTGSPTWSSALTISSGNVAIAAPSSGTTLTVTGTTGTNVVPLTINTPAASSSSQVGFQISRTAGTTANNVGQGACIGLSDTLASPNTSSVIQQSGGQTEFWQYNSSWNQVMYFNTNRGVVINAPSSGTALSVSGTVSATTFSGAGTSLTGTASSLTAGAVTVGSNSSNTAFAVPFVNGNSVYIGSGSNSSFNPSTGVLTVPSLAVLTGATVTTTSDLGGITINGAVNNVSLTLNNTQSGATSNWRISSSATGSGFGAGNLVFGTGSSNFMNISSAGNVTVNGCITTTGGNLTSNVAPSSLPSLNLAGANNYVTITNGSTYTFPNGSGMVFIYVDSNSSSTYSCCYGFTFFGVTAVTNIYGSLFSNTGGTSGKLNLYYTGSAYVLQNSTGITQNLYIAWIQLRPTN